MKWKLGVCRGVNGLDFGGCRVWGFRDVGFLGLGV